MNKLVGAVVAMSFAAAAVAGGPPRFVYVDLGGIDPNAIVPLNIADAINDAGVATGRATVLYSIDENGAIQTAHAFKAAPGEAMVDIATQPEIDTFYGSRGWDINDKGVVVGEAVYTDIDLTADHMPPVMWVHGTVISLGLPKGAVGAPGRTYAQAVNDRNQIVGPETPLDGEPSVRSFLWENGQMRLLDEVGDFPNRAWDINNLGHIVGQAGPDPNEGSKPYIVRDGKADIFDFLGKALAINDLDQVVGSPGFIWENDVSIELPDLPNNLCGFPYDINNYGDIVGECTTAAGTLWREGVAYNLNDLIQPSLIGKIGIGRANGINNRGQIVGFSSPFGSIIRSAYRLDPVTPDLSGDGVVNTADLADLLLHWGPIPERKPYFWTK